MKLKDNRFVQIFLLLVVLMIWGMAGYKYLDSTVEPVVDIARPAKKKNKIRNSPESYTLLANYRDPFLDEFVIEQEEEVVEEIEPLVITPPVFEWPNIEYHGQVKNKNNKQALALVTIQGNQHLLKAGQRVEDLMLVKIFRDSVIVSRQKEIKTVVKN